MVLPSQAPSWTNLRGRKETLTARTVFILFILCSVFFLKDEILKNNSTRICVSVKKGGSSHLPLTLWPRTCPEVATIENFLGTLMNDFYFSTPMLLPVGSSRRYFPTFLCFNHRSGTVFLIVGSATQRTEWIPYT